MSNMFNLEFSTIWSFKDRGNWKTHKGDYPGNWSPFVPKNIILRYSKENDLILDQFIGSGTTLVEAKLLKRRGIGCDVNPVALELSQKRIKGVNGESSINLVKCTATNLNFIKNDSIDLICTHPPYSNIIKYSRNINDDLSLCNIDKFYESMGDVAKESYRVLKHGRYCVIMMGDVRQNKLIIPLGFNVMKIFINQGFSLKEIIIKEQHNCRSTDKWIEIAKKKNFLLIQHEYIFVFVKELF